MKIILVSHGSYAKGLLESVQMLAGEQTGIVAYGLYPQNTVDSLVEELKNEIEKTTPGEEILCLTDLFFGSPFNAVIKLMEHYDLYHVTGISLPLLLEAIMDRNANKTCSQVCDRILALSKDSVKDARKYLEADDEGEDES